MILSTSFLEPWLLSCLVSSNYEEEEREREEEVEEERGEEERGEEERGRERKRKRDTVTIIILNHYTCSSLFLIVFSSLSCIVYSSDLLVLSSCW